MPLVEENDILPTAFGLKVAVKDHWRRICACQHTKPVRACVPQTEILIWTPRGTSLRTLLVLDCTKHKADQMSLSRHDPTCLLILPQALVLGGFSTLLLSTAAAVLHLHFFNCSRVFLQVRQASHSPQH